MNSSSVATISPAAVLPKLLKHESLSRTNSLFETVTGSLVQGVQSSKDRLFWCGNKGPLSVSGHRGHLSPLKSPTGSQLYLASTRSGVSAFLTGCKWISASPTDLMGCRGRACFTMVLATACRGISAPALGAPPPLLFPLTLVPPCYFPSHVLISLSSLTRRKTAAHRYRCQQVPPLQGFLQDPTAPRSRSHLGFTPESCSLFSPPARQPRHPSAGSDHHSAGAILSSPSM